MIDDAWELIFTLDRLSAKAQWDELRDVLKEYRGEVPFHAFSLQAFRRAAAAGHRDILETMTAKNFALPAGEGAELIEELARRHLPQAESAIGLLLQTGHDGTRAVVAVAAQGTPAMMETLRNRGCDVQDAAAFAASLRSGNTAMMQYLSNKGADLYGPAIASALQDVNEKNPAPKRGPLSTAKEVRRLYDQLVATDCFNWTKYYIAVAGGTALEEMRDIPYGVRAEKMTLMHVAARAGCADDIISAALRETKQPLTADDLLRADAKGASVLSIMAVRGEAKKLFDVRLWWRKPEDAVKLHAALESVGEKNLIDPAQFAADIRQYRLKALAGRAIRLPRRP